MDIAPATTNAGGEDVARLVYSAFRPYVAKAKHVRYLFPPAYLPDPQEAVSPTSAVTPSAMFKRRDSGRLSTRSEGSGSFRKRWRHRRSVTPTADAATAGGSSGDVGGDGRERSHSGSSNGSEGTLRTRSHSGDQVGPGISRSRSQSVPTLPAAMRRDDLTGGGALSTEDLPSRLRMRRSTNAYLELMWPRFFGSNRDLQEEEGRLPGGTGGTRTPPQTHENMAVLQEETGGIGLSDSGIHINSNSSSINDVTGDDVFTSRSSTPDTLNKTNNRDTNGTISPDHSYSKKTYGAASEASSPTTLEEEERPERPLSGRYEDVMQHLMWEDAEDVVQVSVSDIVTPNTASVLQQAVPREGRVGEQGTPSETREHDQGTATETQKEGRFPETRAEKMVIPTATRAQKQGTPFEAQTKRDGAFYGSQTNKHLKPDEKQTQKPHQASSGASPAVEQLIQPEASVNEELLPSNVSNPANTTTEHNANIHTDVSDRDKPTPFEDSIEALVMSQTLNAEELDVINKASIGEKASRRAPRADSTHELLRKRQFRPTDAPSKDELKNSDISKKREFKAMDPSSKEQIKSPNGSTKEQLIPNPWYTHYSDSSLDSSDVTPLVPPGWKSRNPSSDSEGLEEKGDNYFSRMSDDERMFSGKQPFENMESFIDGNLGCEVNLGRNEMETPLINNELLSGVNNKVHGLSNGVTPGENKNESNPSQDSGATNEKWTLFTSDEHSDKPRSKRYGAIGQSQLTKCRERKRSIVLDKLKTRKVFKFCCFPFAFYW